MQEQRMSAKKVGRVIGLLLVVLALFFGGTLAANASTTDGTSTSDPGISTLDFGWG
jgi:hypothetical protein